MRKSARITIVLGVFVFAPLFAPGAEASPQTAVRTQPSMSSYFRALDRAGIVDTQGSSRQTLITELKRAETLLREGADVEAAIALYSIVESPRYEGLEDFVEFQNSIYYLGVALSRAGAPHAALEYFLRAMEAGPSALYYAPAHRKAVDIALSTQKPAQVLTKLEARKHNEPLSPAIAGERSYLRARIAYEKKDFSAAESALARISQKSRLYSSALYLRGVIRTQKGEFNDAAANFCEIAATPDDDKYTFVVDARYFRIKDLARLGLARVAHETEHYENAYYHYFQIPEDSDRLPDALFEAAWSMYQKRELGTSRDLVSDFLERFPSSPLVPQAQLLAGFVELADCKFDRAQKHYEELIRELTPVVTQIQTLTKRPDLRAALFDKALVNWRADRETNELSSTQRAHTTTDKIRSLLQFDREFVRIHSAVHGLGRAVGQVPYVRNTWEQLKQRLVTTTVRSNPQDPEQATTNFTTLLSDVQRLQDEIAAARDLLRAAQRAKTISPQEVQAEKARLQALDSDIEDLETKVRMATQAPKEDGPKGAPTELLSLVQADLTEAQELGTAATALQRRLQKAADEMADQALRKLHREMKQVLDKAILGKIDAVIGQKRKLEIEVQDLAAGRFPPELHGKLWEEGLIEDDEEYWPFEGEFWSDEYSGWR